MTRKIGCGYRNEDYRRTPKGFNAGMNMEKGFDHQNDIPTRSLNQTQNV